MSPGTRIDVEGAELTLRPDPSGVILDIALTGALRGMTRRLILQPDKAGELGRVIARQAAIAAEMRGGNL